MTQPTKLQRWLDLIAYLVGRRFPVSADELMRAIPAYAARWNSTDRKDNDSVRRTFERDKDELRKLGIPIQTIRYTVDHGEETEGYQISRRDFYLPYLKIVAQLDENATTYHPTNRPSSFEITRDEAPLALSALRRVADVPGFPLAREARSAFRKLAFDLDPLAFRQPSHVLFVDKPGAGELADKLRVLTDALLSRKRVSFTYRGMYRGDVTTRDVDGYGLMFQHGNWYLVGYDTSRDGIRVFRAGRMENVTANRKTPGTPDYVIPDDFTLEKYADREPWVLGEPEEEPMTAEVRFAFPLSLWAERNSHGTLTAKLADGAQLRTFELHQVEPFLRWILSLEGDAEITSPETLRAELKKMADAVVEAHT